MEIPAKVKKVASALIERYGDRVERLGKYRGAQAYCFQFPDNMSTGFPFVYLFKEDKVTEITGFEALDIIGLFIKDTDEL